MARATNTDGVLPTERDLRGYESKLLRDDAVSREHWSHACVTALIRSFNDDVIIAIADGGYDKWRAVAAQEYVGHGFKDEDFKRMFDILVQAAERRKLRALKAAQGGRT